MFIISYDGFKYYTIFVDHYFKYVWLFPLKSKSDVFYIAFKHMVEICFQLPIISFYFDNRGEFLKLKSFFHTHGINHFLTTPHSPNKIDMLNDSTAIFMKLG